MRVGGISDAEEGALLLRLAAKELVDERDEGEEDNAEESPRQRLHSDEFLAVRLSYGILADKAGVLAPGAVVAHRLKDGTSGYPQSSQCKEDEQQAVRKRQSQRKDAGDERRDGAEQRSSSLRDGRAPVCSNAEEECDEGGCEHKAGDVKRLIGRPQKLLGVSSVAERLEEV